MTFNELTSCPVCGNKDLLSVLKSRDYHYTLEPFHVTQCQACGLQFTNPKPSDLTFYYDNPNYISHQDNWSIKNFIYNIVRVFNTKYKVSLIRNTLTKGNILDFGTGSGHMVDALVRTKKFQVHGYEPNLDIITRNINHPELIFPSLESLRPEQYDLITAWHVLEHVEDLLGTLKLFKQTLKSNGKLIIAVPNINSYDSQIYKEHWAALDLPRHLYHFTPGSISHLFQQNGFKLIDTNHLPFDSYFISMISSAYRNDHFSFLRGVINGYISNKKALNTKQYSSMVYTFEL